MVKWGKLPGDRNHEGDASDDSYQDDDDALKEALEKGHLEDLTFPEN